VSRGRGYCEHREVRVGGTDPTGSGSGSAIELSNGRPRSARTRRTWSKLPCPTRRLRRLLEGGVFSGFRRFPSRPRAWTRRRCTPTIHGWEYSSRPRYSGRPSKADRDGRPRNGVVGPLDFNSRWTRTDTCAVQERILVPESGAGLRRPVQSVRFGRFALSCASFVRIKSVANALPPRPTRSLHSLGGVKLRTMRSVYRVIYGRNRPPQRGYRLD